MTDIVIGAWIGFIIGFIACALMSMGAGDR